MKNTLKSNLFLGLGLALILLLGTSFASFISIRNLIRSSEMVRHSNAVIDDLNDVLSRVKDAETGQRGYLLTGNEIFLGPYNNVKNNIDGTIDNIAAETINNPRQQKNVEKLRGFVTQRMNLLEVHLNKKKANQIVSMDELLNGKQYMDGIRATMADMKNEEKQILEIRTTDLNELASYIPYIIIVTSLLSLAITLFFFRKISSDFEQKKILRDELQAINDETETRIREIKNIAAKVSNGDYNIRFDEESKDNLNSLADSLNAMTASLRISFDMLAQKEWLQTGMAQVNEQLVGEKTIPILANDILDNLVQYSKSEIGTLYILENDNQLHLAASYALNNQALKKIFAIGEGIVGQCAQSQKTILLKDIPDIETTISYALGTVKPRNIITLSIIRENKLMGVMEFGSLHNYTSADIEFLEAVSDNIGIAIYTAHNLQKLQELLEETQSQSEELQSQTSELENINAELEAQSQKLQASEEELRVQQEELLQSNQELEERSTLLEERNELIRQRNSEIQLKSKELEQSSKYKSEFLANMSHELRTPLNSILLLSKLMADSTSLDKEYVEYADVIQSSGHGLLSLIDEILDLSTIESGKMNLEITDVRPEEITRNMGSLFMPVAKNKNVEFRMNIAADVVESFQTDRMRMEQILKNLLSNAFKFTAQGFVSLTISQDDAGKNLLFEVADTGIGIKEDKLKLVFEAFQQADGSTRRRFGGTGLGLSISKELAKLLGGKIKLQSKENAGSQFTLSLPVRFELNKKEEIFLPQQLISGKDQEAPVAAEIKNFFERKPFVVDRIPDEVDDDRDNILPGDKVILIVEDDTSFAKILLDYTRKKNYKGLVAVSGDQGLEMANHFKPKAILLDLNLPVLDGWQVMDALKSNPQTKAIPVHMMSSMEVKKESLQKGAIDFINKPFALEEMQKVFEKLEKALRNYPKKVLIVEENQQHAKALSYYLTTHHINSMVSDNINGSIEALKRNEIDCVILDMGIPDKNGYQTLETIKQNKEFENLPIIVFTGKNLSQGEENRIKKYADSIVVKTAFSYQRILDEAGLFLHLVEEKARKDQAIPRVSETMKELRNVLKSKTVLIVDDDVRNLFSLTKALESQNMHVLTAINGKEALHILEGPKKPDAILMDMMMPEMDGYETIHEIRKIANYKNTPVLAVTAKSMLGDREKCIAAGASDYISKPVDADQLVSLLRVWLYDKL
ncbi:MAG: response regulator [Ginsengibacter sp.]